MQLFVIAIIVLAVAIGRERFFLEQRSHAVAAVEAENKRQDQQRTGESLHTTTPSRTLSVSSERPLIISPAGLEAELQNSRVA